MADRGACRKFGANVEGNRLEQELTTSLSPGRLYECRRCGLAFRNPVPDSTNLDAMYAAQELGRWAYSSEEPIAWEMARSCLTRRYSEQSKVSVLDVGAFDGRFLATLPAGWTRFAIEPSREAQQELIRNGIKIAGDLLGAPPVECREQFQSVCLFDVFEHLSSPGRSLQDAAGFVKPGGLLIVSTGNASHWTWRLMHGRHWYLASPQHIRFATPRYLRRAASSLGLEVLELRSHAHKPGGGRERAEQAMTTAYFALRQRSVPARATARLLRWLPGPSSAWRSWECPYLTKLKDHLFCVMQKPVR